VQKLNRLAVEGLDELPGSFRPGEMSISHSRHNPPSPSNVPEYVDDLCDYVNENWHASAWHLAAYVMWRLNWIHPFQDVNGRTSRALSYLILCIRLGIELPGRKAIPDFIAENKKPYYEALDAADVAAERGEVDVHDMESLLQDCLAEQLASFHGDLTQADVAEAGKATEKPSSETKLRQTSKLHHAYNKYPFWFWVAGILVAVILTLLAA
jgi:Fic family protein